MILWDGLDESTCASVHVNAVFIATGPIIDRLVSSDILSRLK